MLVRQQQQPAVSGVQQQQQQQLLLLQQQQQRFVLLAQQTLAALNAPRMRAIAPTPHGMAAACALAPNAAVLQAWQSSMQAMAHIAQHAPVAAPVAAPALVARPPLPPGAASRPRL